MTEPNPWSREGAADKERSDQAWPAYPPAPNSFGYDADDIPDYPGAPGDAAPPQAGGRPAAGTDPYPQNPYPQNPYPQNPYDQNPTAQDPYGQGAYGQNPYAQGGYGQNPYGSQPVPYGGTSAYGPPAAAYPYAAGPYGYTATIHPQAVTSLVLGVIGLVICSIAGIAAFFVGRRARREILAQPQRYSGLGMATAGWVLGMIAIAITVLGVLFVVIGLAGGWD